MTYIREENMKNTKLCLNDEDINKLLLSMVEEIKRLLYASNQ